MPELIFPLVFQLQPIECLGGNMQREIISIDLVRRKIDSPGYERLSSYYWNSHDKAQGRGLFLDREFSCRSRGNTCGLEQSPYPYYVYMSSSIS